MSTQKQMEDLYRADPRYTAFSPTTAKEAVELFHKTTNGWCASSWDFMPELMVRLAKDLPEQEVALFEQWIQNPTGVKAGEPVQLEDLHRVVSQAGAPPPSPSSQDEKSPA